MKTNAILKTGFALLTAREPWQHHAKTPECPTIPQLDRLAGSRLRCAPGLLLHTNLCPYCRRTLSLLREEMKKRNVPSWPERVRERWEEWRAAWAQPILAGGSAASTEVTGAPVARARVPTLVVQEDRTPALAHLDLMRPPAINDNGQLMLAVRARDPDFEAGDALELAVAAWPAGVSLDPPQFVPVGHISVLRFNLPSELRDAWRDIGTRPLDGFPFRFVIRPHAATLE